MQTNALPDILLAYRAAALIAERPEATAADHAAWLAAQSAYYAAGGRDPANGWASPLLPPDVGDVIVRVSGQAAAWFVRHGHFDRIDRDPCRYCVANWGGHPDKAEHALGRPLTPDESAALEACIRVRLSHEARGEA